METKYFIIETEQAGIYSINSIEYRFIKAEQNGEILYEAKSKENIFRGNILECNTFITLHQNRNIIFCKK